ncbi:Pkinase-domain-containing protein [Fragilariopsis cylindrus CCMP1102]|uniref:Pkinase-domain-containing protein n=1 Tax=Fragilariopsis cylindrus CCMP1102 TaxID=635003 RepID=A0A1E7FGU1_9STRA|nr:Pkinase-domain-containing protein [Fragilariopsis cylindrus CCMP1102]|eukprot:OEU16993.1 Pkinase-domain-containing protein [Fragilariopsis cylindrus CCMP1102]
MAPHITEKKRKARKNKSTDPDFQIEDENDISGKNNNDDSNTSLVTAPEDQHNLEGSIRSFTVLTPTNRELGASVQVTDALADVRTKYHVNSNELGHGHYGVVRKCMDRKTNEYYAIKSIRKNKVKNIEVLKREISILKEVKHPHIIELVDVFEDPKYLHLVTELCTGGELFDRIIEKSQSLEGHYSEHDAALIIRDILDAIAYCHSKGIVHRDLKPENFLFSTKSEGAPIKIIDFGLSRHNDANHAMKTKVGTPYYVAPEVLRRDYTEGCDIWSIGVISYILLCGYPPFYGDNDAEIFNSVRSGQFDYPSPEWDEISNSAKQFVSLLLQIDPEMRPTALEGMDHPWITKHVPTSANDDANPSTRASFQKYLAMQKLKKVALVTIAKHLSHEEVGTLEDIFRQVDQAGDGVMSLTEINDSILRAKLVAVKEDLSLSDDDTLNWKAFLAATIDKNLVMREDKIRFAFDHFFHSENKDYLTLADFESIFDGDTQGKELFNFLDTNGDGKVSYDDFRVAMEECIDIDDDK